MKLFGSTIRPEDVDRLVPDLHKLAGIRQFREENGAGAGMRVIRVESGGGLSVEILPDRALDIGQVWCDGVPFGWTGPIGAARPAHLNGNQPLSGLMSICGFDHIRQPEDDGRAFPKHGNITLQPAELRLAAPVETERGTVLRVEAVMRLFDLRHGGMKVRRRIDIPLGGQSLHQHDEVEVFGHPQPVMAMYHINFGWPLAGPESVLTLDGADISGAALGRDGVTCRDAGQGVARLAGHAGVEAPQVELRFASGALPAFQTLRDATPGINLICLEPASHPREPRAELRARGLLPALAPGTRRSFGLSMTFAACGRPGAAAR